MLHSTIDDDEPICIWGTVRETTLYDLNSEESFELEGPRYPPGTERLGFYQIQLQPSGKYKLLRKIYL